MMKLSHQVLAAGAALALATSAGYGLRVLAEGAPSMKPVFYSGTLEADGKLASGTYAIVLALYETEMGGTAVCSSETTKAPVVSGRFRVEVSADCVAAMRAKPDLWAGLKFTGPDGVPHELPDRTKVGAVPYAMEAQHAVSASTAAPTSELASQLATLQQKIPAITPWTRVSAPVMRTTAEPAGTNISGQQTSETYRRVGDSAEVKVRTVFSAVPSSGSFVWELPPGLTPDMSKVPAGSTWLSVGVAEVWNGSVASICSVNLGAGVIACDCDGVSALSGTVPRVLGPNAVVSFSYSYPVAGWAVTP